MASAAAVAWIALLIAVCAMSSGGVWFALLKDTAPGMKAAWRLTVTSILQLPGVIYQHRKADSELLKRWREKWPILVFTGVWLAVHFVAWSWSVSHTSLTHSLLLVSSTPLVMVAWMALRSGIAACSGHAAVDSVHANTPMSSPASSAPAEPPVPGDTTIDWPDSKPTASSITLSQPRSRAPSVTAAQGPVAAPSPSPLLTSASPAPAAAASIPTAAPSSWSQRLLGSLLDLSKALPPTRLEAIGAILGFLGAAVLVFSAGEAKQHGGSDGAAVPTATEPDVTVEGDLMAFVGALAIVVYLEVGGMLRKWMPLFLYAFPVTASSAVAAALMSLLFEHGTSVGGLQANSLFGWLGDWQWFGLTFAAALCSGILGHTLANYALEYIHPLVVSVAVLWEPLIGSLFGWLAGVQSMPGIATFAAGPLLLIGAVITTLGSQDSSWPHKDSCTQTVLALLSCKCVRGNRGQQLHDESGAVT